MRVVAKSGQILPFLSLITLVYLCRNALWVMPSALMTPIMDEMRFSYTQIGYLSLVVTACMGVFLICGSYVMEPLGTARALIISMLCCAADGFCSYCGTHYVVFMIGKVLCGVGYGLSTCAVTVLIASSFPKEKLGFYNGLNACLSSLAIAFAYQMIVPIYRSMHSWKSEAGLWGAVSLIAAILLVLWQRRNLHGNPAKGARRNNLREALSVPVIRLLIVLMGCASLLYATINSYFPNFLTEVRGFPLEEASSMAGLLSIAGILGSLIAGTFSGKVRRRKPVILLLAALMTAGFLGMLLTRRSWSVLLAVFLYGGSYFALNTFCFTTIMLLPGITPFVAGAGISLMSACGSLLAIFVPNILDRLASAHGLQQALLCLSLLLIPAFLAALQIRQSEQVCGIPSGQD